MSPKAKSKSKTELSVDQMSYEQAFEALEVITQQLEDETLALDAALALFERGQALAERCGQLLEAAELKVRELLPDGQTLADFEADEI